MKLSWQFSHFNTCILSIKINTLNPSPFLKKCSFPLKFNGFTDYYSIIKISYFFIINSVSKLKNRRFSFCLFIFYFYLLISFNFLRLSIFLHLRSLFCSFLFFFRKSSHIPRRIFFFFLCWLCF